MGDPTTTDATTGSHAALPATTIVGVAAAAVAAQLAFVALAWWRPETTWHLAPLLAAAAPGVIVRLVAGRPFDLAAASASSLAVASLGELTVLGLWETELLRGPALVGDVDAGVEHLLGVVIGALIGWRAMTRPGSGDAAD